MEQQEIQQKIEAFLKELGIPSFIVFGWQKTEKEFGIVSSQHNIPSQAAIKGMSWALHDFINKSI